MLVVVSNSRWKSTMCLLRSVFVGDRAGHQMAPKFVLMFDCRPERKKRVVM